MRHLRIFLAAIVMAFSASAHASPPLDIDKIVIQQREIRADLIAGTGRYDQMPASKREEIVKKQDDLLRMLEGKATSDDLSEDQRVTVLNSLESIEAAISSEEGERKVCTRERTLGSNRLTRVCRTEAQMAAEREQAREQLDRDPQLTR
jgi:hypothetical protein